MEIFDNETQRGTLGRGAVFVFHTLVLNSEGMQTRDPDW